MDTFDYSDSPYAIRDDIKQAHRRFWDRLAAPGCWWNGADRIAIAREVRAASHCDYCAVRRQALSPYNFKGKHQRDSDLNKLVVDTVHRIVTDQTRITQTWINQLADSGLSNEAYVELAGIVVSLFSIDEFHRGLSLELEPLPTPRPGEPSHYRPAQAVGGTGFVPMLPIDGATGEESDLWHNGWTANVLRALSVVPDAVRDWMNLSGAQYLTMEGMGNMIGQDSRAINRMQMELIAGRVSSINECFY